MASLSKSFNSSQGRVAFDVFGSGPDIVLVHGTPSSSFVWRRVVERLQQNWRVFIYDLPGYGESEQADGQDVRLRTQARVLSELLRHWELAAPHLVGHDFGAATVLGAHLVEGCAASRITILDGVVLNPWGTPYSLLVKQNIHVFEKIPEYVHAAALTVHLRTAVSRHLDDGTMASLLAPWLGVTGQKAYYRQVAQYDHEFTEKLETLYPTISVPLQILWGGEDRWVAPTEARRFQQMVPGASLTYIPDGGHFVMLDCPNMVGQLIDGFAAQHEAVADRVAHRAQART